VPALEVDAAAVEQLDQFSLEHVVGDFFLKSYGNGE
jgi:hypothetical protein